MAVVTMKQLLEAGVHFGPQTRRWDPKMERVLHGERAGVYIIDLHPTPDRPSLLNISEPPRPYQDSDSVLCLQKQTTIH